MELGLMSIYCTFSDFDDDDPGPEGAPLAYQGSHVLPDDGDPRGGHLSLGYIPAHITRDGVPRDDDDDGECWPFLRVMLQGDPRFRDDFTDTCVLDAGQVHRLRDHLTVWLVHAGVEPGDWIEAEKARRERWGEPS